MCNILCYYEKFSMSTSQQHYSWEFRVASDLSIGWQRVMVVSVIRSVIDVTLHRALLALRWVTGIPPQYVTSQLGQLSLASLRGPKLITSSAGVTSGNVTSAKWQVMLCYSIWHVSCHSSEAGCKLLYCLILYVYIVPCHQCFDAVGWAAERASGL